MDSSSSSRPRRSLAHRAKRPMSAAEAIEQAKEREQRAQKASRQAKAEAKAQANQAARDARTNLGPVLRALFPHAQIQRARRVADAKHHRAYLKALQAGAKVKGDFDILALAHQLTHAASAHSPEAVALVHLEEGGRAWVAAVLLEPATLLSATQSTPNYLMTFFEG